MSNPLFRRKDVNLMIEQSNRGTLERSLGALDLTFLGIGAIIGTGIFVLTGVVAANHAGPAVCLSFVIAAIACCFAALCYAEFASAVPASGSVYTYTYATMGELLAFLIGWDLMLEYLLAVSAVANGWSGYFQGLIQGFGLAVPTALGSAPGAGKGGMIDLPAVIIIIILGFLLSRGVKESKTANNIMVVVKLTVVIVFIIVGVGYVKPENWTPFIPAEFGFNGVVAGAATVFFAYVGFDAVSTAAEEVKNPQRDLPIGLIASLGICTALYVVVSLILTGIVPYTELNVSNPVAYAIQYIEKDFLAGLISLGAITGITTVILVMMFGQVRIAYSMSRDGLLPKFMSTVHPKFKTPYVATWTTVVVAGGFAAFIDLNSLAHLVNIGTMTAFILVSIGVIVMRKTHPDLKRHFVVPFVPVFPGFAVVACLYLMFHLPAITWICYAIWLAIGFVVYMVYGRHNSNLNENKK